MTRELMPVAIDAARAAAALLRERFAGHFDVERKHDGSLVTTVDTAAEQLIVDTIRTAFPRHGIIGEERGEDRGSAETVWIIDPLDGTHNFIRGLPLFGVCIGIAQRGEFVAGVIALPMAAEIYAAERGGGAFCNETPIRVSQCDDLEWATLAYDSGFRRGPPELPRTLETVAQRVFNVRMTGSSAINLSALAAGKVDACVEFDDCLWDFAAGVTLVREAGGRFTDHAGNPVPVGTTGYVASNGRLHEAARAVVV